MQIRSFLLFFSILKVVVWATPEEEVDRFICSLPAKEVRELEIFFHSLMDVEGSGVLPCINYALWGDKPIATNSYFLCDETGAVDGVGESAFAFQRGLDIWERLSVSPKDKNYFFLILNNGNYRDLVCINRKAFLRVIEENITIFRYVLGPNLTSQDLLQQMIENKDNFYDVIKGDRALFGILLGYGTQNALLGTWKEIYEFMNVEERKEEFPLIAKQKRLDYAKELQELKSKWTTSSKLKPFSTFRLPIFGCDPYSNETQELLATYERNREQIKAIAEDKHFLRKMLLRLLTTSSGIVELPQLLLKNGIEEPPGKNFTSELASAVQEEIKRVKFFHRSFLDTYLNGIEASEKGKVSDELKMKDYLELYQLEDELEKAYNLQKADSYFSKKRRWVEVIPQKIYYKKLQNGSGDRLTKKSKHITFHYTFEILNGMKKDSNTAKQQSLSEMIPGVSLAILGMHRGEIREIYIHPEYGYGEENFLAKNAVIIAKIELVDFEGSEGEVQIAESHQLRKRNFLSLYERYQDLKKKELFENAIAFWNFIKQRGSKIDFVAFKKAFLRSQPILSKEEREKLIAYYLITIPK